VADEAASSFLDRLDAADRKELEAIGHRRSYRAGQVLFSEGDDGHDVVVLLAGSAKVLSTSASGREVILDVLVVSSEGFASFLEQHGRAATALLECLVGRLRRSSQRQLEFGTGDALSRLAIALMTMLDRYATAGDRTRATIPLTQNELAAMTGLSREAVVKGLRAMRALGWLELRARELTVLDEEAMRTRTKT